MASAIRSYLHVARRSGLPIHHCNAATSRVVTSRGLAISKHPAHKPRESARERGPKAMRGGLEYRKLKLRESTDYTRERRPNSAYETARQDAAGAVTASLLIGDQKRKFSPVLLRDLCSCAHCVDTSTRQKHFVTADIPSNIQVASLVDKGDSIAIKWSNDVPGYNADHTTELPHSTLAQLAETGDLRPARWTPDRVLWDARTYEEETRDMSHDAYMEDDVTLFKALQQLHSHGLLFITGVPEDEKSVKQLANRIGPLKTTFYGETWDVRSVPQAKNVAYTSQNLGFHMDLMYMQQPPHLQLLHCIRSSSAGGASLFSDSFKAAVDLAAMDSNAFTSLTKIKVPYHYDHNTHYYHQSRPVIEQQEVSKHGMSFRDYVSHKDDGGSLPAIDFIDAVSWAPPFQAPFALPKGVLPEKSGSELLSIRVAMWHGAAKKFNELIHRREGIYERLMKPGECVIFDNRRVLHARRAFEVGDAGKERWLRGAYIDKDPFMSKLKIMNDQFGKGE